MKMSGNNLQVEKKGPPVNGQTKIDVPVVTTALELSNHTKIDLLTEKFEEILQILGLDPEDDSLRETPRRIARLYINEIFKGLDPGNQRQGHRPFKTASPGGLPCQETTGTGAADNGIRRGPDGKSVYRGCGRCPEGEPQLHLL